VQACTESYLVDNCRAADLVALKKIETKDEITVMSSHRYSAHKDHIYGVTGI
jgi:hypothetical protein